MKVSLEELLSKILTAIRGKVNKSGDTMTGPLVISNTTDANNRVFSIKRDNNNVDVGWDWTNKDGAGLGFRGADAPAATFGNPGGFTFYARDENNSCYLDGYPDGRLIWNGESVFGTRSFPGWDSPNNYVRFPNGLQMCWGRANFPSKATGGQEITVNFPVAFFGVPTVIMGWQDSINVGSYMEKGTLTALSSTTTTVLHAWANRINANSNWWANYLAIGPWK